MSSRVNGRFREWVCPVMSLINTLFQAPDGTSYIVNDACHLSFGD